MPPLTVTNWFGDLVSHPQVVVEAHSAQDVAAILKDPAKYPSPVRAIGSKPFDGALRGGGGRDAGRDVLDEPDRADY